MGVKVLLNGMIHKGKIKNKGWLIEKCMRKENTKASRPRKGTGKVTCSTVEPKLNIIYVVLNKWQLIHLKFSCMHKYLMKMITLTPPRKVYLYLSHCCLGFILPGSNLTTQALDNIQWRIIQTNCYTIHNYLNEM